MSNAKLAICIPSFNRLEQAKKCVASLLDQIGDSDVNIQVIDNGSDQDYLEQFSKIKLFYSAISNGKLSIIRNPFNIGMGANFMRSFEVANGDWLWMVADDDDLCFDAVKSVLEAVDGCSKDFGLIVFGGLSGESLVDINCLRNLEEFIDFNHASVEVFNRFIFLTNGVYELNRFRPLLSVGYQYLNTFIPHFMMQIAYMQQGNKCVALQKNIVDYVIPEIGYSYSIVAGLGVGSPKHALIKTDSAHYSRFLSLFFPHNDYKVIIDLYYACKRDASLYVCRYLASNYLHYVATARTFLQMFTLRCFVYILRSPKFFEKLILIGERLSPKLKKHMSEIRIRYS